MELITSSSSAMWFLPLAIPISLWVTYYDMKFMKIPNMSVLALFGVFVVIGFATLPIEEYLWRFAHLGVVLGIGFVLSTLKIIGAGDAKFAAAMAPFVAKGDVAMAFYLLAAAVFVALMIHRLLQRSKAFRKLTPDWESWDNKDFPMGFALAGTLVAYLALGVAFGQ